MPDPISSGGRQIPGAYRHVQRGGSNPSPDGTPATDPTSRSDPANPPDSTDRLDLGEDLSAEEREMITDQFPASEEKSLQVYGRTQNESQLQPDRLGRQLDLRG